MKTEREYKIKFMGVEFRQYASNLALAIRMCVQRFYGISAMSIRITPNDSETVFIIDIAGDSAHYVAYID